LPYPDDDKPVPQKYNIKTIGYAENRRRVPTEKRPSQKKRLIHIYIKIK